MQVRRLLSNRRKEKDTDSNPGKSMAKQVGKQGNFLKNKSCSWGSSRDAQAKSANHREKHFPSIAAYFNSAWN
jgi:hypothetical protein